MSMQRHLEIEEKLLEDALEAGEISSAEYTKEVNELYRDYQASAEEAAQEAYDDEMGRW